MTATTQEIIEQERVLHIAYKELRLKKLFGKLMLFSLKIQQKLTWKQISQHHFTLFNENKSDFATVDETWIHQHDPESKLERLQWT